MQVSLLLCYSLISPKFIAK